MLLAITVFVNEIPQRGRLRESVGQLKLDLGPAHALNALHALS